MASRTPSLFQVHNGSPAGSSLAPLGSISNPASCDRCVEDPTNETSSELFTFHAYMPVIDDFPKGPSNPGDDVPPADTPTSPTIQAQEDTNVIEGHLADPAEYPAEDTADTTDATCNGLAPFVRLGPLKPLKLTKYQRQTQRRQC